MHADAPVLLPVFVMDPAAHSMHPDAASEPGTSTYLPAAQPVHASIFDAVENFPSEQAVHADAPALMPVFVMDPAAHMMQLDGLVAPDSFPYSPAAQPIQKADAFRWIYFP